MIVFFKKKNDEKYIKRNHKMKFGFDYLEIYKKNNTKGNIASNQKKGKK